MAEIKLTNELLKSEGQNLINFSENLNDKLKDIDTKINQIADGWKGLSEESYMDLYDELKTKMAQFPQLLQLLGQDALDAAESFGETDEGLSGAFKNMDY